MRLLKIICLQLFLFLFCQPKKATAQQADLIPTNGEIFTSDDKQLYVQALGIRGNKILATGSNAAIAKLATSKTKRIDLKGKVVVPGFNDAHDHPDHEAPIGKSSVYQEMIPTG